MRAIPMGFVMISVAVLLPWVVKAEDDADKPKTEAEIAAAQDANEAAKSGLAYQPIVLKGRIQLNPIQEGETVDTPVGNFFTKQGNFLVKFAPESIQLRTALLQRNGKEVTLSGKLRNERKYFVVMSDLTQGATPAPVPIITPGGL